MLLFMAAFAGVMAFFSGMWVLILVACGLAMLAAHLFVWSRLAVDQVQIHPMGFATYRI